MPLCWTGEPAVNVVLNNFGDTHQVDNRADFYQIENTQISVYILTEESEKIHIRGNIVTNFIVYQLKQWQ